MRHRWIPLAVAAVAACSAMFRSSLPAEAALEVLVTSTGDDEAAECPHETACTLRKAIELINADEGEGPYAIAFDATVFETGNAEAIVISGEALPPLTKAAVTIDGSGRSVTIQGSALTAGGEDGLVLLEAGAVVRKLGLDGFDGRCLALEGAQSLAEDLRVGDCGTGIAASGIDSRLLGNAVGFDSEGDPSPVTTGILINGSGIEVGDPSAGPGSANVIGNASTAVQVGTASGSAVLDVLVAGNIVGKPPSGAGTALVGTAVRIDPPAGNTTVSANLIANTAGNGVVVGPDSGSGPSTGNRFSSNRFEAIGGMSIDLGANSVREANDPGDDDAGPNTMLNHPVITRAVQSRVQGTSCAGCRVEIYAAQHFPGGAEDFGATPIPGGTLTAGPSGVFELNAPPVTPGQWITAIGIDGSGNTSEFGPSVRVGAGVAQCGNVPLQSGWNLVGFFGAASLPLGASFPPGSGPASPVGAIYRLLDGTLTYQAWFAAVGPSRTLHALEPGEAYWMHALSPVTVTGGFSLTLPLPVTLQPGWNEFVYIGAAADVRDALSSISGRYTSVYRWANTGDGSGRWSSNHAGMPAWAQGFTTLETCGAYSIFVSEPVTLTPLQP